MTALQKIQAEVKKMRKANPKMPYQTALKQASKNYNSGKLGAAKKAPASKAPAKKKTVSKLPVKKIVTTVTKEKIGAGTIGVKTYISIIDIGNELKLLEDRTKDKSLSIAQKNLFKRQFKALKVYLNTKAKFV